MWTMEHEEERDGFTVRLYTAPETDVSIADSFEDDDIAEFEDKVDRGLLYWFMAKVTASKAGVTLGEDHLGACLYESAADFMQPGGYYDDMVGQVIDAAKAKLAELGA